MVGFGGTSPARCIGSYLFLETCGFMGLLRPLKFSLLGDWLWVAGHRVGGTVASGSLFSSPPHAPSDPCAFQDPTERDVYDTLPFQPYPDAPYREQTTRTSPSSNFPCPGAGCSTPPRCPTTVLSDSSLSSFPSFPSSSQGLFADLPMLHVFEPRSKTDCGTNTLFSKWVFFFKGSTLAKYLFSQKASTAWSDCTSTECYFSGTWAESIFGQYQVKKPSSLSAAYTQSGQEQARCLSSALGDAPRWGFYLC